MRSLHFQFCAPRTSADRALFQNRQESVDRFGALLRNYQGSRKGLQQYPERSLQDLRYVVSANVLFLCRLLPRAEEFHV